MLGERIDREEVGARLRARPRVAPLTPASDRKVWDGLLAHPLNQRRRERLVGAAEAALGRPWPALPATLFMEFVRTGDRERYQRAHGERRRRLIAATLAECFEHEGRFLDDIADGAWLICEEATWCLPAHARSHGGPPPADPSDPLPRQDRHLVDLTATATARLLADLDTLLSEELEALSPSLRRRAKRQALERVVHPVLERDDLRWFTMTNNWASWCAAETLGAAGVFEDDPDRLAALTWKTMGVVDQLIDHYAREMPDGWCDEGPNYWGMATGSIVDFVETLAGLLGEDILEVYREPLLGEMARSLPRSRLDGPWFVNFSDASARPALREALVWRAGERLDDDALRDLALLSQRRWDATTEPDAVSRGRRNQWGFDMAREALWVPADAEPTERKVERSRWFADSQVVIARETTEPGRGWVLAAKGGHNATSHNHNDVGHFMLLHDGRPVIVDVGAGEYRRETFSDRRYSIWFIRGSGHNAPVVNGIEQPTGRERRATNVEWRDNGDTATLSMNLEQAYPPQAGLASLRRAVRLDRRARAVTVTDAATWQDAPGTLTWTFYTPRPCQAASECAVALETGDEPVRLDVSGGPTIAVESIALDDETLKAVWGAGLTRLRLTVRCDAPAIETTFRFTCAKSTGASWRDGG